jgi:hypothetical protein
MIGSTLPGTWIEPIGYGASTMFDGSWPAPNGGSRGTVSSSGPA